MKNRTVLVIDDNRQDRALMSLMLQGAGFSVMSAVDGSEAMQVYSAHCDDIVLIVVGSTETTRDASSFIERVRHINQRVPVLLKSAETWSTPDAIDRSANRLKPLSLMAHVLHTLEGEPDSQAAIAKHDVKDHCSHRETVAFR